ncbi:MAG: hypothetical protein IBX47_11650 [Desulfuromonadales bacterium]|nr:hypothetical protein [Desulfuromonadales bacterium]
MSLMTLIESNPFTTYPILLFLLLILLYLARHQAHRMIRSFTRITSQALRLMSKSLLLAEKKLKQRNREVLLAAGAVDIEKGLEREFQRVDAVVKRDLQTYPAFHRNMSDLITRIDEDYQQSTEVPPSPPAWISAIEAVAQVPNSDGGVAEILGEINKTLDRHHKSAMDDYRKSSQKRHALLNKMMPFWRKLGETLDHVGKTITGLHERSELITAKMDEYEKIRAGADDAERRLSSSSLTQFFISGLVMVIAIGGAIINFNLIALPMSEMVGGGSYIGNFKISDVAALVIILVEISMGLFLMESLRITHLFPVIGQLDDRMRRKMIWISFALLFTLAGVESALAFMRDQIAADLQALRQSLSGAEVAAGQISSIIPTAGQMVLGFVLPFALTFVAIPLESFVHSSRTVIGLTIGSVLRIGAFLLRLTGNIINHLGKALVAIYDLLIFPAIWIEEKTRKSPTDEKNTIPQKEVLP